MVKLGGEARGDKNPQGSAPPQQQQEKDSGGGGEDKSGVGRSSSVTRIMENARIKVACLGVVYHCNKASLKPVDLSRRNNAPFPTSSSSKSSSSALSMNISQLKLQFFQSKERAEEQAKREWKIRRSLRNHRQRLLKIVNGFQNLEQRLVGGMALPRVKPYRVVNRPAVFSLSLSNAFRLCTKYPGSFEIACDEKEQKEARKIVRAQKGEEAAKKLDGAPLFSIPGVQISLKSELYKPYFLSKVQLDKAWTIVRRIRSQSLISKRKMERRAIVAEVVKAAVAVSDFNSSSSSNSSDAGMGASGDEEQEHEEADAGSELMEEPPEIKEFLEELGEGGDRGEQKSSREQLVSFSKVASSIACSTTALLGHACCKVGDIGDHILLDHPWGWRMLGMNPDVNVEVNSLPDVLEEIREKEKDYQKALSAGAGMSGDEMLQHNESSPFQIDEDLQQLDRESDIEKALGVKMKGSEDLDTHGSTIECFLDWNKATQKASAESKDESTGPTGLLFIGSIVGLQSAAMLSEFVD